MLRGKKQKRNILRADILEEYQGRLKTMKEPDLKRLIVQLLIMRILKERFESQTIRGTSVKNIMVVLNVTPNRPQLLRALERGELPVLLSDGVQHQSENTTVEVMAPVKQEQISNVGDYKKGVQTVAGSTLVQSKGRTYVKQKTNNNAPVS